MTLAVDQGQRPGSTQATQVGLVQPHEIAAAVGVGADGVGTPHARQFSQDVSKVRRTRISDRLFGDRGNRSRLLEVGTRNARTRDDDFLDLRRFLAVSGRLGVGRSRNGNDAR
ncbi:hypothetical protein D3C86_1716620 [compost metagenome]